jgi:endonuclease/exonuclease/phosphatase family metal-dependent hydrolase
MFLFYIKVKIGQSSICFLNTHLESMSSFARTRMDQMIKGFEVMKALAETDVAIFAGDFNITDSEVNKFLVFIIKKIYSCFKTKISTIGGLPQDVVDVWEVTGSRKESEFTWNLQINDNKRFPYDPQPRFRFDRIFVKQPNPVLLDITAFDLIGLERVKPDECFPSDHWGIRCDFKFK